MPRGGIRQDSGGPCPASDNRRVGPPGESSLAGTKRRQAAALQKSAASGSASKDQLEAWGQSGDWRSLDEARSRQDAGATKAKNQAACAFSHVPCSVTTMLRLGYPAGRTKKSEPKRPQRFGLPAKDFGGKLRFTHMSSANAWCGLFAENSFGEAIVSGF